MPEEISQPKRPKGAAVQLDELFAPWNRTDAPGLVVAVAKGGSVLYRRGFGMASLESPVANTTRTRMRIGSTSKHFTALLALLLADEGKLDLDVPIRTYIPELTGPGGDPSIRLLLQHRGGSRCYLDLQFLCHGMTPPPVGTGLRTQVRQKTRNFAPGEAMIYNNGGYHLTSIAIERIDGTPFEAQLKQRLFDPLGMYDTASIRSDYVITPGGATLHVSSPDGGWRRGLFPTEEIRGEGAIVSTVDDILCWMAHLRSREKFGSPSVWAALTELPIYPGGATGKYALGLMIDTYRGVRTVRHAGGVIGGSSEMLTVPEHALDVVILVNGAPGADPMKLAEQVVDILLAPQLKDAAPNLQVQEYAPWLGDWWSAETGMVYSLVDDAGALKLSMCNLPTSMSRPLSLDHLQDGRIVVPSVSVSDVALAFDRAHTEELCITFGGRTAAYEKLSRESADTASFAAAAVGRYYSADADCTAVIAQDGERLVIGLSDAHGGVAVNLQCLGESVAVTAPQTSSVPHWSALSFAKRNGIMTGFRMNSMRTRNLEFERRATHEP